jgi:serine protease
MKSACGLLLLAGFSVLAGCTPPAADSAKGMNPYSPRYGHPYRHGAIPTRTAHANMQTWWTAHRATQVFAPGTGIETLSFGGGIDGIGVTSGAPRVYLVIYGSQWGNAGSDADGNVTVSGDSNGEVPRLQQLFKGFGTGGELWSGTMTQYCDGSQVSAGATSCAGNAAHVAYPTAAVLAGVWYDNSIASPASATGNQLASEAIKAAAHFGNTTAASNRYAQYVILSPPGTNPDGFNTSSGNFCAWHDYNADAALSGGAEPSGFGDIAFTNMPYVTDAGSGCGASFVNSGAAGALDGVTIVEGHEYAETLTDQNPAGGWTNQTGSTYNGEEDGDECAWIASGQGASANVVMGNGSYPMQSTWSNDTNRCDISHPVVH